MSASTATPRRLAVGRDHTRGRQDIEAVLQHAATRAHLITDDPWASRTAVTDMHRRYARCPVDVVVTAPPHDHSIGHSGLFRSSTGAEHWPDLASWLTSTSGSTP